MNVQQSRRDQAAIKVRPLPEERVVLEERAKRAGTSLAAYLLSAGLGAPVHTGAVREQDQGAAAPAPASRQGDGRTMVAVNVRALPEDWAEIKSYANTAGMPLSAFMRAAALGVTIKSVVDLDQVHRLAKIHADQGRLGGLLKLWLSKEERFAPGYPDREQITQLLDSIRRVQDELRRTARQILDHF